MSGKLDTVVKVKSAVGQQFLQIIGRSSSAVEGKKEKKASKDRLETAMKALAPWYDKGGLIKSGKPKTVGALGWMDDEHDLFTTGMDSVDTARKADDYKRAAELAEKAKEYAESLDKAKTVRAETETLIQGVRTVLGKLVTQTDASREISVKLAREADGLRSGLPPEAVQLRVKELATAAKELLTGTSAPKRSPVEEKRYGLQTALNKAVNAEEEKMETLIRSTFSGKDDVPVASQAINVFRLRMSPVREAVMPGKAEAKLDDDDARIALLQKSYEKAVADLPGIVKTFTDELKKNKGADFKRSMQSEVGKQETERAAGLARATFLKDYAAVESALADLADIVAPTTPALATAVAAAKQKIVDKDQYEKGPSVIETMLKHIAGARLEATKAATGGAKTLSDDLAALRSEIAKQGKSAHKRCRKAFDALTAELDQLEVIVKTNNVAAFASANERLAAIRKTGVTDAAAITRFNEMVDAIEKVTSDSTVAKEFQSDNNDILLAVKTVIDPLSLFELDAAQKTMNGLKRDADKLKGRAEKLGPWREDMKSRLKTLETMIKEFHKLMPGTKDTTFELNYKKALDLYGKPGVDCPAVTKLVTEATALVYPMINNLGQAGTGQARTINALEADRKLGQAQIQEEEEKKRLVKEKHDKLKADLDQYERDLKIAKEKVNSAPNGDKDELKRLTILGEQARKKFKSGDEDDAASQLKSIRKSLTALIETPGGVTAESLKTLADADGLWAAAMKETRDLLDKIVAEATPAAEAIRVAPGDVKKQIDSLYNDLQPFRSTLVRAMKIVGDATSALKLRKAEREYALRDIRSMRSIIDGNPVAAKLAANPFAVAAPFVKLRRFLSDMEYNAMRAVPPE